MTACLPCAGAERLKEALQALGLKCGGTLRQRAERLMLTKGKRLEELDKSLFAKGAAPAVSAGCKENRCHCPAKLLVVNTLPRCSPAS